MKISIIGLGFVGSAILESFTMKNTNNIIFGYDKYKNGGIGSIIECFDSDYIFLALPTEYNLEKKEYDISSITETLDILNKNNYTKCIVIKSTISPMTTELLQNIYCNMHFVHNPEFLTARTAFHDFHNQKHIVLGKTLKCSDDIFNNLYLFYNKFYPDATLSICSSSEAEAMKIFTNSFYAVKVQYFNELYLLSQQLEIDYDSVVSLMLKNGWINPMHTQVPGPDGKLSYGGSCLPKDANALLQLMKNKNTTHKILEACIEERNEMRK